MFEEKDGLTHRELLVKTMLEESSIQATVGEANEIIDKYLEHCVEIYHNGQICGFLLVMNFLGMKSLHGYKLIEGFGVRAYRIAKKLVQRFNIRWIITTEDQCKTIRLASLLGFSDRVYVNNTLCLERGIL